MSENKPNRSKQLFTVTVLSILVAIVGFQSWYLVSMKQQLDDIQGKHDSLTAAIKPDRATLAQAIAQTPTVLQRIQKDLNANTGPAQQGKSTPADPPSVFDDDFFNQSFFSQNWNPYEEIARMQQEMDRMFNNAFSGYSGSPGNSQAFQGLLSGDASAMQMNLQEDNSKYTVTMSLPGAEENNISVNLDGQQLTVSGEQDIKSQKKDANGNVIFQQHRSGAFQRSITLPEPVKQEGMVTHVDNGVLTITVPKMS